MMNERALQKGVKYKDIIYIFGGDGSNLVEKANIYNWEWGEAQNTFTECISNDELEKFT